MNTYTTERAAIVAALGPLEIPVHDHLPGRAVPPCAMVLHGSPFIDRSDTDSYGHATVHFEVWLVIGPGTNETKLDDLDELLERAITALHAEGFGIDRVEQPFRAVLNQADYLATAISLTSTISLT